MASTSASAQVSDDDLALAEQQFQDGVDCLNADDFVTASDLFGQCLELKVTKHGEKDPAVAQLYLKYAASLLGCARQQGEDVLGALKTKRKGQEAATPLAEAKEAAEEEGDDEADDLALAWQMAELARLVYTEHKASLGEDATSSLAEAHEILADISAERESFDLAIADFEEALNLIDTCEEEDPRWKAEIHFKMSIPLELVDRVDDAITHADTALTLIKQLIKQKQAEMEELAAAQAQAEAGAETAAPELVAEQKTTCSAAGVAEGAQPAAAVADEGPTTGDGNTAEGKAAAETEPAQGDVAAGAGSVDAKEGVAAAAGSGDAEDDAEEEEEEEETELEAATREIGELKAVLVDLQQRKEELLSRKDEEKVVKEQLKSLLGGVGDLANPMSAEAGSSGVQDLGVIGGSKKKENRAVENTKSGKGKGASNAQPKKDDAPTTGAAAGKRTLEELMGGPSGTGSKKRAVQKP